jgi:hypothetical protein
MPTGAELLDMIVSEVSGVDDPAWLGKEARDFGTEPGWLLMKSARGEELTVDETWGLVEAENEDAERYAELEKQAEALGFFVRHQDELFPNFSELPEELQVDLAERIMENPMGMLQTLAKMARAADAAPVRRLKIEQPDRAPKSFFVT